jgi:hypothetical protein
MDYILLSSLVGCCYRWIAISYDIACQWSKNLLEPMTRYPVWMWLTPLMNFTFGIPKFHLGAHGLKCLSVFSWNFLRWSARTDGEGIKRIWAHINPLVYSTREMGPGLQSDTLDVHWSAWNWRKVLDLGAFSLVLVCHV